MEILSRIGDACLDFFFPKKVEVIALEAVSSGELLSALAPAESTEEGLLALFNYRESLVKDMVWELKYGGNRKVAKKLGEIMYDAICDELYEKNTFVNTENSFVLVPVPMSDKRRFERGWNQAELLCEAVKKIDKEKRFKYLPRQLAKFRHTESQTHTSGRAEREENIKNSMRVLNRSKVEEKHIILVDDVCTTGATLREAKRALKEAGAKEILCVTVAH